MDSERLRLGVDGTAVTLKDLTHPHLQVIGASGGGKSKFLELVARAIVESGAGFILLDGKGDLYRALLGYCVRRRYADRTVLFDPTDPDYAVGLNYLEALGGAPPETVAANAVMGLKKASGEALAFQPTLEEWAPAAFQPLVALGLTLLEARRFINLGQREFRERVLAHAAQEWPDLAEEWAELLTTQRPSDVAAELSSLRRRLVRIGRSKNLRAIFGQTATTIDWLAAMRRGVVLINGGVGRLPELDGRLIGTAVLHQIRTLAPLRAEGERKPCYVMIDECQRFVTKDMADSLDELRGYGVRFILAHQHLSQIRRMHDPELETLYHAMLANAQKKVVFGVGADDAETLAPELFRVGWRADRVKDEIHQTKFRPTYTRETVVSRGEHEAESRGTGRTTTRGRTSTTGWSSGDAWGSSHGSGDSFSFPLQGGGCLDGSRGSFTTAGASESHYSADTNAEGTMEAEGEIESETVSRGSSRAESDVPFLLPVEFRELTGRSLYSPEDQRMLAAGLLQGQPERHAYARLDRARPAVPIVVPYVASARVSEREIARFKARVLPRCARPRTEVKAEIAGRVAAFLERAPPEAAPTPESGASPEALQGPQEARSWSTTVKPSFEGVSPPRRPSKRPRKARTPGGEGSDPDEKTPPTGS